MPRKSAKKPKTTAKKSKKSAPKSKTKSKKSAAVAGPTQKPHLNVYTMMLILSLVAIITACVTLWMGLNEYGTWPQWEVSQAFDASVEMLACQADLPSLPAAGSMG